MCFSVRLRVWGSFALYEEKQYLFISNIYWQNQKTLQCISDISTEINLQVIKHLQCTIYCRVLSEIKLFKFIIL